MCGALMVAPCPMSSGLSSYAAAACSGGQYAARSADSSAAWTRCEGAIPARERLAT